MRIVVAALVFVALGLAPGCATEPSPVAESFGNAQRANRDAQIQNPSPSRGSAEGLDPRSAEHVLENYSKGQKAQEHGKARKREPAAFIFGEGR